MEKDVHRLIPERYFDIICLAIKTLNDQLVSLIIDLKKWSEYETIQMYNILNTFHKDNQQYQQIDKILTDKLPLEGHIFFDPK
jgi:hypothetical protein